MSKIIKTTQGQADFIIKEEYPDENKAIEGKEPTTSDAEISEIKIENVKYKLKEVLKDE
tara:strand:+ start:1078 stop:1254 length:177 start_codon:yes stop_codon:yes gene_type:complete